MAAAKDGRHPFPRGEGTSALRSTLVLVLAVAAAALLAARADTGRAGDARDLTAYRGLGTWVDIYDEREWADPERTVERMARHGVQTLFLETSNYRRSEDLVGPDVLARFLEAAHARGLEVVAWYLPSLANLARDTRRSLAALRFRTPGGEGFDSFALDIEAKVVASPRVRSSRAATLAARIRAAAPAELALGAIIPAPRGMQLSPAYWPGFPYRELARSVDVFLPMGYFTYRPDLPGGSSAYTEANITLLREATGDPGVPVHVVGGIAHAASVAQVRGFAGSALSGGALGGSLYDYALTSARQWRELAILAGSGR